FPRKSRRRERPCHPYPESTPRPLRTKARDAETLRPATPCRVQPAAPVPAAAVAANAPARPAPLVSVRKRFPAAAGTIAPVFGSNGTFSEPNVNTAASSSDSAMPPSVSGRRCFEPARLMAALPLAGDGHFSSGDASHAERQFHARFRTPFRHDSHAATASQEMHL